MPAITDSFRNYLLQPQSNPIGSQLDVLDSRLGRMYAPYANLFGTAIMRSPERRTAAIRTMQGFLLLDCIKNVQSRNENLCMKSSKKTIKNCINTVLTQHPAPSTHYVINKNITTPGIFTTLVNEIASSSNLFSARVELSPINIYNDLARIVVKRTYDSPVKVIYVYDHEYACSEQGLLAAYQPTNETHFDYFASSALQYAILFDCDPNTRVGLELDALRRAISRLQHNNATSIDEVLFRTSLINDTIINFD